MTGMLQTLLQRREAGIFVMILLITAVVGAMEPRFLTLETARIVALAIPLILIAAMGQMMVLVARHVDLSIGSIMAFSSIVAGMMFRDLPDLPIMAGVVVAIALGTGLGLINGLLVVIFKLPSIIVTLGTLQPLPGPGVPCLGCPAGRPSIHPTVADPAVPDLADIRDPLARDHRAGVAVATYFFLDHTRLGRQIYALGSNPAAAPLRGIKVVPVTLMRLRPFRRAVRAGGRPLRLALRLRESGHHRRGLRVHRDRRGGRGRRLDQRRCRHGPWHSSGRPSSGHGIRGAADPRRVRFLAGCVQRSGHRPGASDRSFCAGTLTRALAQAGSGG